MIIGTCLFNGPQYIYFGPCSSHFIYFCLIRYLKTHSNFAANAVKTFMNSPTSSLQKPTYLPMLQSHNFCFDVLDKTQGTVNAQLDLDTWKIIQQDPFFTPLTVEEIEDNGLDNNMYNQARIILEKIRQKKGLVGTEKIVVAAEKQRTLKKN